jgi:SHS2 domain-containing protein
VKAFEIIDISGDVGLRAFGADLESLFSNAAAGLYDLITDPELIREDRSVELTAESSSLEGLLVSWLNELIFRFDAYGFIGKRIVITGLSLPDHAGSFRVRACLTGEDFDSSRHERRLLVKAATYHMLKIEQKDGTWQADIIFDI